MSEFHPREDDILDVLYRARKPITTNEIAERTGMAWATAKKYLEILEEEGYVAAAERGNSLYWWLVEEE